MNLLSEFEARLGGVVEGMFGAMFRSPVQPAELARAASKEMTRSRKLGVDKQYVANVYFVFISPRDADTLSGLIPTLEGELETYLLAFSRERDYMLVTRPIVRFTVDEGLKRQGKFEIVGQQMTIADIHRDLGSVAGVTDDLDEPVEPVPVRPFVPQMEPAPVYAPEPESMPVFMPDPEPVFVPVPEILPDPEPVPAPVPIPAAPVPAPAPAPAITPHAATAVVRQDSLNVPGRGKVVLDINRTYIAGRHSTNDFPIQDANVSRQHAEFFWDGYEWYVRDLGSTNGTLVNDRPIQRSALRDGDRITLGVTVLDFSESGHMDRS